MLLPAQLGLMLIRLVECSWRSCYANGNLMFGMGGCVMDYVAW